MFRIVRAIIAVMAMILIVAATHLPSDITLLPQNAETAFMPSPSHILIATAAIAPSVTEVCAFTIRGFCAAHGISLPSYFKLRKLGLGPTEMRLGDSVRISVEAAAEWRRARENPEASEAKQIERVAEARRDRALKAAKKAVASPRHVSRRNEVA